ncbi:hypothetical protein AB6A40_010096 [Gnathostoma spinigerum]|uniref:Uncharacterized protein n=1 Tax=Gnathostoma spinigerum TaxID=75299 RepID=A0ABD6F1U4_9BILA
MLNFRKSNEARVFLAILSKLSYREVVVVFVKTDPNALEFVSVFEENRSSFKIHVQKYIELDMANDFNVTFEENFEEVTSNILILYANVDDIERILQEIPVFSMTGKVFIVNEKGSYTSSLPTGYLSVRLRQSPLTALRDALNVLRCAVNFLDEFQVDAPTQCSSKLMPDGWTNNIGHKFYKFVLS